MVFSVAIDGASGVGKSTVAKLVAEYLNITYVNTGAMYRAIGLKILNTGIDIKDELALTELLENTIVTMEVDKVILDGKDVSEAIREERIGNFASTVSKIQIIRDHLVTQQQNIAKDKSVVMEGRDIGTVVLKDSKNKFYLTASVDERARRRYLELLNKNQFEDLETIKKDMEKRDFQDMNRENSPLKKAEDAEEIVTDNLTQEEVAKLIVDKVKKWVLSIIFYYF